MSTQILSLVWTDHEHGLFGNKNNKTLYLVLQSHLFIPELEVAGPVNVNLETPKRSL